MAIVTLDGHVSRALRFMEQNDVYIAIGGRATWEDEVNPPSPDVMSRITDLIAMKKVETKILVVQDDEEGTIPYLDHRYRVVAPEDAYAEGARWVYCMSYLNYDEVPVNVGYRQVALQTGVVRGSNVPEAQYVLLPEEIAEVGKSEIVDFIQPIFRRIDKREKIGIIAEF